jgi:hypothetical protein
MRLAGWLGVQLQCGVASFLSWSGDIVTAILCVCVHVCVCVVVGRGEYMRACVCVCVCVCHGLVHMKK